VEQELLTLSEHMSSLPGFSGARVNRYLVLCVCFVDRCLSLCLFSFGHCVVIHRFTDSDNPVGIFKRFVSSPHFIKVLVPVQENEVSCICMSILPLSDNFLLNFDSSDGLAFFTFHFMFYNAINFFDNDYSCYPVYECLFLSVVVLYLFFF
jgi:hypothetical protein